MNHDITPPQLEKFDELFIGDPVDIESNLTALMPLAKQQTDKSIYLQILSQIALAQAMQQRFEDAHETLDIAESHLEDKYELAKIRLILERGRVYHQSGNEVKALPLFIKSYELSRAIQEYDYHTVNAAHMVAILSTNFQEKIDWNFKSISIAKNSSDMRCQAWLGPLYNNLAQSYLDADNPESALSAFEMCKSIAQERNEGIIERGAIWGIGKSLRLLNKLDKALDIQLDLLTQYDQIVKEGSLPIDIIRVSRGVVYEELAEIYSLKKLNNEAKKYAKLAYDDLSTNPWMNKLYPQRISRMYTMGSNNLD